MLLLGDERLAVIRISSGLRVISHIKVTVTYDVDYICRWSTQAGSADDLTCRVSVITGNLFRVVLYSVFR